MKCSGERNGCDRCRAKSTQCVYSKPNKSVAYGPDDRITSEDPQHQHDGNVVQSVGDRPRSRDSNSGGTVLQSSTWPQSADPRQYPEVPRSRDAENSGPQGPNERPAGQGMQSGNGYGDCAVSQGMNLDIIPASAGDPLCNDSGDCVMNDSGDYMNFDINLAGLETSDTSNLGDFQSLGMLDSGPYHQSLSAHLYSGYGSMSLPENSATINGWTVPNALLNGNLGLDPNESSQREEFSEDSLRQSLGSCLNSDFPSPPVTSPPTSTSSSSGCQCTQDAVRILEALQIDNNKLNPSTFDRILSMKKSTIDQCTSMMCCPICSTTSAFVMLLIVICEKLVISFETWSSRYKGKFPAMAQKIHGVDETSNNDQPSKVLFGAYEADKKSEQCSILRALAMCQLRRLTGLLSSLAKIAASKKWLAHETLLHSFHSRVQGAAEGLVARF